MDREEIIQKYIQNRLSEKDRVQFEVDLQNSEQLQKQYKEFKHIQAAIQQSEYNRLKKEFKTLEATNSGENTWFFNWRIVATIVVLVSMGSLWWLVQPVNNDKLYSQYFTEYSNTHQPIVRGGQDAQALAFAYYENSEYDKAAAQFSSLLVSHDDADIRFYYALSLLNDTKLESAKHELEVLLLSNTEYKEQLWWYLGLVEMKFGNKTKAVEYFQMLHHPQAYNHKNAQKLIAKLSR